MSSSVAYRYGLLTLPLVPAGLIAVYMKFKAPPNFIWPEEMKTIVDEVSQYEELNKQLVLARKGAAPSDA